MSSGISHFKNRNNESPSQFFDRSGRFFCKNGSWFFKTREAIDYGPYKSRVECRYAYNEFIELVSESASTSFSSDTYDYQDLSSNWTAPKINFN